MLRIRDLILPETHDVSELYYHAAQALHVRASDIAALHIFRRSLDARKSRTSAGSTPWTSRSAAARGRAAPLPQRKDHARGALCLPHSRCTAAERPVVVGFGPAGMFAAPRAGEGGAAALVLERGDRTAAPGKVERRSGGPLTPRATSSSVRAAQVRFPTASSTPARRTSAAAGCFSSLYASVRRREILYDAKPHVGTDVLFHVIQNLREEVLRLGGEVRFGARLTGLETQDGRITGVRWIEDGAERSFACRDVILAIDHSARDTFRWLHAAGIPMQPKPFAGRAHRASAGRHRPRAVRQAARRAAPGRL